ncbi:hypothetical protein ABE61_00680 [Lysinibacillus sphaericus]|nr:hypothetical protein [Lysinibacillus sphaericus]MBG9479106.1 hypothetical protein [Lysinibacillus sphaericus]MBG9591290.1 hypothetical protein [Lysinibacillus sphaericus]
MKNKNLICRTSGVYSDELTRGKLYKVIDMNNDKEMVRMKCDNGRLRWFLLFHFNVNSDVMKTVYNNQRDNINRTRTFIRLLIDYI